MECLSPNIHVPDLTSGPSKKKRFQVHSACAQCKKSHAACSMTRPCERCVRVGEAHLCVDLPRKRRGKQNQPLVANQQQQHPTLLDNAQPDTTSTTNTHAIPEDFVPIDEISDFLFEGIENNLLTDNTIRNVSLMEGSALSANALLHSRPLFANSYDNTYTNTYSSLPKSTHDSHLSSNDPYSTLSPLSHIPTTDTNTPSPNTNNYSDLSPSLSSDLSSSGPSPVPSPTYTLSPSPNQSPISPEGTQSPIYISPSSYTPDNYTDATAHTYSQERQPGDIAQLASSLVAANNQGYLATNNPLSVVTLNESLDTEAINAHITNLFNGNTPVTSTSSPTYPSSSWSAAPKPPPSNAKISEYVPEDASSEQLPTVTGVPEKKPLSNSEYLERLAPVSSEVVKGCMANSDLCQIPQCFCNKVCVPGKVQLVCAHDENNPNCNLVPLEISAQPYNPQASLHLVVESLVREVQSLKREIRGELPKPDSTKSISKAAGAFSATGPAVAVWDMVEQKLLECNDTFATLMCVDRSEPTYLTDIAQCPAYFLRLCAANKTSWHEKRKFSLKRPEGDINLVIAIDINATCVVTTVWKADE